ncbi:hypothetical protein EMPS_05870 [Entomortierella parvispora]|uniref:F-box domain-containing protein n=1 Tax=Entomortierella parvispora TaxID=205924 RepID=A0A9P3HBB9_9FUNG|nr:hypothetical protein EMPS_05870 [Entomortierella parvispora]
MTPAAETQKADTTLDHTAIVDLPIEVLASIAQYLVLADNLQDLLHLSRSCRVLYRDLWSSSSDIWPYLWKSLYGDKEPSALEPTGGLPAKDRYRLTIQSRHTTLLNLRSTSSSLCKSCPPVPGEGMRNQILCLLDIGADYDYRNLHWISQATNSRFWAWVVFFCLQTPLRSASIFPSPDTLRRIFDILARLAVRDPSLLEAIYRDKYASFRHLRRAIFCQELPSPQWQIHADSASHTQFPWSMVQVFFMILFCGPTVCSVDNQADMLKRIALASSLSNANGLTASEASLGHRARSLVPSWFNFGDSSEAVKPIPLTALPKRFNPLDIPVSSNIFSLTGRWTGYYAYREFDPMVESESEDENELDQLLNQRPPRNLEHSVRGLRLDRRMKVDLVCWTTESVEQGAYRPGGDPLYLCNMTDLHAMQEVDRCFLVARSSCTDSQTSANVDLDDLNQSENWQHQRIFSGRGRDEIGAFGIRGIISERSGLVRMVKNYFPDLQESFSSDLRNRENGSPLVEFGSGHDRMSFDLNGETIVWYYRGLMETREGPGILGLWYDEDVSGPFWLFPVGEND